MLGSDEKNSLKEEIRNTLSNEEIAKLYDRSYEVLTERDIIQADGQIFRPDRVIFKDNHVIVIDFKTGRRESRHQEQIMKYAELLKSMGYTSIESKIVYLSEKEVVNL
jgi:ATP-dependent helicase/nuclease subunit A